MRKQWRPQFRLACSHLREIRLAVQARLDVDQLLAAIRAHLPERWSREAVHPGHKQTITRNRAWYPTALIPASFVTVDLASVGQLNCCRDGQSSLCGDCQCC